MFFGLCLRSSPHAQASKLRSRIRRLCRLRLSLTVNPQRIDPTFIRVLDYTPAVSLNVRAACAPPSKWGLVPAPVFSIAGSSTYIILHQELAIRRVKTAHEVRSHRITVCWSSVRLYLRHLSTGRRLWDLPGLDLYRSKPLFNCCVRLNDKVIRLNDFG